MVLATRRGFGSNLVAWALVWWLSFSVNRIDGFSNVPSGLSSRLSREIFSPSCWDGRFFPLGTVGMVKGKKGLPCWSLLRGASSNSCEGLYFENISIEYCPGCRWMTKAFWMATELLQKSPETELREVTVIPSEPGNFVISARVRSETEKGGAAVLLWDRKVDGGFPPIDLIEFEQRVRACLEKGPAAATATTDGDAEPQLTPEDLNFGQKSLSHVVIRYCPGILLRAAYYGQELLTTFCEGELDAISLQPMESSSSEFSVGLQAYMQTHQVGFGESPPLVLWDNSDTGKFPEVKELKRLVRDKVTPQKDLGHSEDSKTTTTSKNDTQGEAIEDEVGDCVPCNAAESDTGNEQADEEDEDDDFLDNDEAEEARRYFGVM